MNILPLKIRTFFGEKPKKEETPSENIITPEEIFRIEHYKRGRECEDLKSALKKALKTTDTEKKNMILQEILEMQDNSDYSQAWKEFEEYFNEKHPFFLKKLTESCSESLSEKEYRIAVLRALQFHGKEVGEILGLSIRTIETLTYKIRKKLKLNPEVNITNFLSELL